LGSAGIGGGGIQPDRGRSPSASDAKPTLRRTLPRRLFEGSDDLTVWNAIATVTNLTDTVEFADPDAALSAKRFYLVLQP
jgi:hypothetical protein